MIITEKPDFKDYINKKYTLNEYFKDFKIHQFVKIK